MADTNDTTTRTDLAAKLDGNVTRRWGSWWLAAIVVFSLLPSVTLGLIPGLWTAAALAAGLLLGQRHTPRTGS